MIENILNWGPHAARRLRAVELAVASRVAGADSGDIVADAGVIDDYVSLGRIPGEAMPPNVPDQPGPTEPTIHPAEAERPSVASVCSPLPAEVRRGPTDSEGNRIEPGDELIFQGMALVDKPSGGKTFDHFDYTPVTFCGVTPSGVWILLMKPDGREPYVFKCPAKPRLFRPGRQPSYVTSQEAVQAMQEGDMR